MTTPEAAISGSAPARLSQDRLARVKEAIGLLLGDRVSDARAALQHHSEDEAYHSALPDLVAFPKSTEEVAEIAKICNAMQCPIVPWGAGTSLEGNALAVDGGLCLDLSTMDEIVEIHAEDLCVTVQPGVRREQLNHELRHSGLFFPIDPGANATLGGMAATRASGTNAIRYGTMRQNVLRCTAVLADGRIITTGRRAPKSAAGYDMTALLVGSEGTLGIITELTIRLHPIPEHIAAMTCVFPSVDAAVGTVILAIQSCVSLARIELLDEAMMSAINAFEQADFPASPTLAVEFHGSEAFVEEQMARFLELVEASEGTVSRTASTTEERSALWKARHNALYATKALKPGKKILITDVCVPISRLADCLKESRLDIDSSPLTATIAGHVGDGNFHAFILVDIEDTAELEAAEELHHRMAKRAVRMDGTCTGEHGIGLGKRELLVTEAGECVAAMAAVKAALDPSYLLNPGKIFLPSMGARQ